MRSCWLHEGDPVTSVRHVCDGWMLSARWGRTRRCLSKRGGPCLRRSPSVCGRRPAAAGQGVIAFKKRRAVSFILYCGRERDLPARQKGGGGGDVRRGRRDRAAGGGGHAGGCLAAEAAGCPRPGRLHRSDLRLPQLRIRRRSGPAPHPPPHTLFVPSPAPSARPPPPLAAAAAQDKRRVFISGFSGSAGTAVVLGDSGGPGDGPPTVLLGGDSVTHSGYLWADSRCAAAAADGRRLIKQACFFVILPFFVLFSSCSCYSFSCSCSCSDGRRWPPMIRTAGR